MSQIFQLYFIIQDNLALISQVERKIIGTVVSKIRLVPTDFGSAHFLQTVQRPFQTENMLLQYFASELAIQDWKKGYYK